MTCRLCVDTGGGLQSKLYLASDWAPGPGVINYPPQPGRGFSRIFSLCRNGPVTAPTRCVGI